VHRCGVTVCESHVVVSDETNSVRAGRPRSSADAKVLRRFEHHMTLPLVLAAVLPLVLIPGGQRNAVAVVVNVAAWLVFVADLLDVR